MPNLDILINKFSMVRALTELLQQVFQLPEVNKVKIRDIEIYSVNETDKIHNSVEECYHDVLSDIDVGIHVSLHPFDIGEGQGYHSNPERIGLTRNNYLGLSFSDGGRLFQLYRVILKSGIRFDIGFYITEDNNAPIYDIVKEKELAIKDLEQFWPRWDLTKADTFWFTQIHALAKLLRGDYLMADHLANIQINETLVAQMIDRDNRLQTNFHRYGYKEILDYTAVDTEHIPYLGKDDTYNRIVKKLYSTAVSYDRLVKKLNPDYEQRLSIFLSIWKQYLYELSK